MKLHSSEYVAGELAKAIKIPIASINEISLIKGGMTNTSYRCVVGDKRYAIRIPGEGTAKHMNRKQEKAVYDATEGLIFREKVYYYDENTGTKVSKYYEGSHNANPRNENEIKVFVELIKQLHGAEIEIPYEFNLQNEIARYEKICIENHIKLYEDFANTKMKTNKILAYLNKTRTRKVLCHIDSVSDNLLILPDKSGVLIDWEYAGMSDPITDIAMFGLYSFYSKAEFDKLLELYFARTPTSEEQLRYYSYVALGGFLWYMWAVNREATGVSFGDYAKTMYGYTKDFYEYIKDEL